ncbi:hypothetical protein [Microcoleus sp. B7-D4]|uniref:hypothetical protein n=1 Tax=Microcoleus sp. B7-D4 TaxID=2818696 RepID=UPI002FD48023
MQLTTDNCCIGFMRSLFHFRRSIVRNKKGRSPFIRYSLWGDRYLYNYCNR